MVSLMQRRRAMMLTASEKLPTVYQEVEYLYETGKGGQAGGMIDTGVLLDTGMTIELGFYSNGKSGSSVNNWGMLFSDNQYQNATQFALQRGNNTTQLLASVAGSYTGHDDVLTAGTHTVIIDIENKAWIIDGGEPEAFKIGNFTQSEKTVLLFGGRSGSTYYNKPGDSIRIHHWIVKRNGKKIQHLVACKRKSDSVPGMYDLIGKAFHTNIANGSFYVGANVN